MEVLEIAKVNIHSKGEIVLPAELRSMFLCVVWEGTLIEKRNKVSRLSFFSDCDANDVLNEPAVWRAGDWTGPILLQPNRNLSCESGSRSRNFDIIAKSGSGVKVSFLTVNIFVGIF